jgi:predicted site-specific integrase-resolvase
MDSKHLNVGQLAERWHLSTGTLDHWRRYGKGPLYLKVGGKVLYRVSDIEAFEAASVRQETEKDPGVEIMPCV